MSSIENVPSYVMQNLSSVQDNLKSITTENLALANSDIPMESILNSTFSDIVSTMSDADINAFGEFGGKSPTRKEINSSFAGTTGNTLTLDSINKNQAIMKSFDVQEKVDGAYDSLLNGEMDSKNTVSSLQNNSMIESLNKINSIGASKSTAIIGDNEFFNAEALNANQIDKILKQKNSPLAYQNFDGKTIGQLIYEECHNAGNSNQGPKTINPAIIVSIMGAESGFATDPKNPKENPFNIRVNGSFQQMSNVKESLNMAVNTMYNWAIERPKDSTVSLFDYAGNKYCENYTEKWKPNVEKYYMEFTLGDANALDKNQLISKLLSSPNMNSTGLNISQLMNAGLNPENSSDIISKTAISAMNNISKVKDSFSAEDNQDLELPENNFGN